MVKLPQLDPMTAAQPPDQNLHLNACLDLFSTYLHLNIRFEDIFNQTYQNLTAATKIEGGCDKTKRDRRNVKKLIPALIHLFVCGAPASILTFTRRLTCQMPLFNLKFFIFLTLFINVVFFICMCLSALVVNCKLLFFDRCYSFF